jgi:hypothetical protein
MKTLLSAGFLLLFQTTFGQVPKDYHNKELLDAQKTTAKTILTALENGKIEEATAHFKSSIHKLKNKLNYISTEISKVKYGTELSIVIMFDQGFNIYICTYYNDIGALFQVVLFMSEGEANSKVKKVGTKNSAVLEAERNKRMGMKDIPPPPPPPPPPSK